MRLLRLQFLTAALILAAALAAKAESYVTYQLVPVRNAAVTVLDPAGFVIASGPTFAPGAPAVTGTGSVSGFSTVGEAKVGTTASGAGFATLVYAGWRDALTFEASGHDGEHGFVTFAMNYSWNLAAAADPGGGGAVATAMVDINFGPTGQYAYVREDLNLSCDFAGACSNEGSGFTSRSFGGGPQPTFNATTAFLTFDFIFGDSNAFDAAINAFVQGGAASASVDATHSLQWGGIVGVVDAAGNAVDFSVHSTSGFDYTMPFASAVPEPSSTFLLALGLAALAVKRKARWRAERSE